MDLMAIGNIMVMRKTYDTFLSQHIRGQSILRKHILISHQTK